MAVFRIGHVIGAISGNLGAMNFAQGRQGLYVRKRATKCDRQTERQLQQRVLHQSVKSTWRNLTDKEKETWKAAAKTWHRTNRLGMTTIMSGSQLHAQLNVMAYRWGFGPFNLPPNMQVLPRLNDVNFEVTLPNTYTVSGWGDALLTPFLLQIQTARPVSGTPVHPVKHWRITFNSSFYATTFFLKPYFIAQWGEPVAGEYVYLRIRGWRADYLPSEWTETEALVS